MNDVGNQLHFRRRQHVLVTLLGFVCAAECAAAENYPIPSDFWARPRSGLAVLHQPSIRAVIGAAVENPAGRVVIHYPPGDEPQLQAAELRYWLTALAVDPEAIQLQDDLRPSEPLMLELREVK
jgi:hypothetical protein